MQIRRCLLSIPLPEVRSRFSSGTIQGIILKSHLPCPSRQLRSCSVSATYVPIVDSWRRSGSVRPKMAVRDRKKTCRRFHCRKFHTWKMVQFGWFSFGFSLKPIDIVFSEDFLTFAWCTKRVSWNTVLGTWGCRDVANGRRNRPRQEK